MRRRTLNVVAHVTIEVKYFDVSCRIERLAKLAWLGVPAILLYMASNDTKTVAKFQKYYPLNVKLDMFDIRRYLLMRYKDDVKNRGDGDMVIETYVERPISHGSAGKKQGSSLLQLSSRV